jgi:multiple antibiotic resistance protein
MKRLLLVDVQRSASLRLWKGRAPVDDRIMLSHFDSFLQAFIPLFIAIDPIGLAAVFLALGRNASPALKRRISFQASLTGGGVSLLFLFLGQSIFSALSITVKDFQIGGGLILFILAARDIIQTSNDDGNKPGDDFGVVPLGMPLIAGPATITTLLLLAQTLGLGVTTLALVANLVLVVLAFVMSEQITHLISVNGLRAISKIISMLLAAIAVNMIRRGF